MVNHIKEAVKSIKSTHDPDVHTFFRIKRKLSQGGLCIAKADKGESLVILPRADYVNKIQAFLEASGAVVTKYNFTEYNAKTRSKIKNSKYVITEKHDSLLQMNASLPKLYGQIKTHKPQNPIRPVVAYFTHPSYKLAKYLVKWFKTVSGFVPKFAIKNSIEVVCNLSEKKFPPHASILSFDCVNMYTNIPVDSSIRLMVKLVEEKNISKETSQNLKNFYASVLSTTYVSFKTRQSSSKTASQWEGRCRA